MPKPDATIQTPEATDEAISRLEAEVSRLYERLSPYRRLHLPLMSIGPRPDLSRFVEKQVIATEIDALQTELARLKLARDEARLAALTAARADERQREETAIAQARAQREEAERVLMAAQRREREAKERRREGDEAIRLLQRAVRQHRFDIGRWHDQGVTDQRRMDAALAYPAR